MASKFVVVRPCGPDDTRSLVRISDIAAIHCKDKYEPIIITHEGYNFMVRDSLEYLVKAVVAGEPDCDEIVRGMLER